MKKIINSPKAPAPIGPYSQAVLVEDKTLYASGQIAINQETGHLVTDSITAQTNQVMKNIGYVLEEAGMDYSNIVKCSIFVKDMNEFATINEAYGAFFSENPPARETVEVARLPKDVGVEISFIAIK
ncbi:RidA family protein [Sediminitomix flava]|uniref:2-iminobutanoate/2-iminopropanoate deaminase n=1 Tax=Sediminitomix flava TaxID=379075 RepID=A0A315ZDV0_SEDFL|nr:RidA family protein [Sediminitomix flava]PWJ43796.1 2-iminobutanoate/2-iminopropanoate deaminase [Sediminitomix flava]